MDRHARHTGRQRRSIVTSIADDIEETTENRIADRNGYRTSGRMNRHTAFKSGGCLKRDTAHSALIEMCLDLDDEDSRLVPIDDEGFVKLWELRVFEGDVDHRSAYGENFSYGLR